MQFPTTVSSRRGPASFFLAAVLLAFSAAAARAGEDPSSERSAPEFYVGVCAHFGQGKGIPANNLALMEAAGIRSLRDELSWGGVEQQRGRYLVAEEKSATFCKAAELGIEPMLILDYANRLYDQGDRPRSADALDGYAGYAEALAAHFGRQVRMYEVWNEYDIGIGMPEPFRKGGSPQDYVAMLKHVFARLKQSAPHVEIIGGAVTPGGVRRGWLEEALELGLLDHCDVLSIHTYNYGSPAAEKTPEAWRDWMLQVDEMVGKYSGGRPVPMYVTEMGWPTHAGMANSTPPELSASYLGRLYLLARTLPFMKGVWWYDYQDDGWEAEHNEHNFGIIRPDLTPKPSYCVMADVADLAARGEYLGRVESEDPALWILKFRLDGREVWAAWSGDDRPRQVLLRTATPDEPLVVRRLGNRPVERGWGYRPWAVKGGRAPLAADQAAVVIDDRPWLLCGGMETAELVRASTSLGDVAEP